MVDRGEMNADFLAKIAKDAKRSIEEKFENHRRIIYNEYPNIFPGLLDSLETFLAEHSNEEALPAVDIGSGKAAGVVELALGCRKPAISSDAIEWYPTEWAGPPGGSETGGPLELETRAALRHCVERAARNKETKPLFQDESESPVFKGDVVDIGGLQKATQLNGKRGIVQGPDPKKPGRYGVQLSRDSSNLKSLKQENLSYGGSFSLAGAQQRMFRLEGREVAFFEGLLQRCREVDVLRHETWSNLEDLKGKCALVTCTSLLSCLGYRDPTAWQDTMELATELLRTGGILMQYDTMGYAGFGNSEKMQSFSDEKSLGLKLHYSGIPPSEHGKDRQCKLLIWLKA